MFGVTYKRDVNDMRESPALDVLRLLEQRGAELSYTAPFVPSLSEEGFELSSQQEDQIDNSVDCVVICANHSAFDYVDIPERFSLVVDTRNALKGMKAPNVFRL